METWTTKDGRRIPIREMTDQHLKNAIRFLERNDPVDYLGSPPTGEMASYYWEREIDVACQHHLEATTSLTAELTRRGIKL